MNNKGTGMNRAKGEPKHSGFEGPTIGVMAPRGTKFKHNADGTITPVYPKQKSATKKK